MVVSTISDQLSPSPQLPPNVNSSKPLQPALSALSKTALATAADVSWFTRTVITLFPDGFQSKPFAMASFAAFTNGIDNLVTTTKSLLKNSCDKIQASLFILSNLGRSVYGAASGLTGLCMLILLFMKANALLTLISTLSASVAIWALLPFMGALMGWGLYQMYRANQFSEQCKDQGNNYLKGLLETSEGKEKIKQTLGPNALEQIEKHKESENISAVIKPYYEAKRDVCRKWAIIGLIGLLLAAAAIYSVMMPMNHRNILIPIGLSMSLVLTGFLTGFDSEDLSASLEDKKVALGKADKQLLYLSLFLAIATTALILTHFMLYSGNYYTFGLSMGLGGVETLIYTIALRGFYKKQEQLRAERNAKT